MDTSHCHTFLFLSIYFFRFFWWLQFMPYLLRCEPIWAIALKYTRQIFISLSLRSIPNRTHSHTFNSTSSILVASGLTKCDDRVIVYIVGISFSFSFLCLFFCSMFGSASTSRLLWAAHIVPSTAAVKVKAKAKKHENRKSIENCQTKAHHFN